MERVRDAVVAAIDERRLMVSWFYIESREHALRASEEKYRNSINHAPDPMYEIEPTRWIVLGANSAAERCIGRLPGAEDLPLMGRRLTDLVRPRICPRHPRACGDGGAQWLRPDPRSGREAGRYFDVNSALITFGNSGSCR